MKLGSLTRRKVAGLPVIAWVGAGGALLAAFVIHRRRAAAADQQAATDIGSTYPAAYLYSGPGHPPSTAPPAPGPSNEPGPPHGAGSENFWTSIIHRPPPLGHTPIFTGPPSHRPPPIVKPPPEMKLGPTSPGRTRDLAGVR